MLHKIYKARWYKQSLHVIYSIEHNALWENPQIAVEPIVLIVSTLTFEKMEGAFPW